jgi:hypothetical protein
LHPRAARRGNFGVGQHAFERHRQPVDITGWHDGSE